MNYTVENDIVYLNDGSGGQCCIGNAEQYNTTQADTQTVYRWQKFNADTGVYEDDTANTTPINGITPTNGQVAVAVTPTAASPTLESLQANQLTIMSAVADLYTTILGGAS
jgi:hypothetical protein